jgi:hypothetical protein
MGRWGCLPCEQLQSLSETKKHSDESTRAGRHKSARSLHGPGCSAQVLSPWHLRRMNPAAAAVRPGRTQLQRRAIDAGFSHLVETLHRKLPAARKRGAVWSLPDILSLLQLPDGEPVRNRRPVRVGWADFVPAFAAAASVTVRRRAVIDVLDESSRRRMERTRTNADPELAWEVLRRICSKRFIKQDGLQAWLFFLGAPERDLAVWWEPLDELPANAELRLSSRSLQATTETGVMWEYVFSRGLLLRDCKAPEHVKHV